MTWRCSQQLLHRYWMHLPRIPSRSTACGQTTKNVSPRDVPTGKATQQQRTGESLQRQPRRSCQSQRVTAAWREKLAEQSLHARLHRPLRRRSPRRQRPPSCPTLASSIADQPAWAPRSTCAHPLKHHLASRDSSSCPRSGPAWYVATLLQRPCRRSPPPCQRPLLTRSTVPMELTFVGSSIAWPRQRRPPLVRGEESHLPGGFS